jgi:hypothetical protein
MPYNAKEGITYINGSDGTGLDSTSTQYVGGSDIPLGTHPGLGHLSDNDAEQNYLGANANPDLGSLNPEPFIIGSIKDRAPNEPSGYSVLGVPTYGDGKRNTVTTWASDTSKSKASSVVYYTGASGAKTQYEDFTS